jgi:hypothetical protein
MPRAWTSYLHEKKEAMTAHTVHSMHANSLRANRTVDKKTMSVRILGVYRGCGVTDQQIADILGVPAWLVRPRICDLLRAGKIVEDGNTLERVGVSDPPRFRKVRLTRPVGK